MKKRPTKKKMKKKVLSAEDSTIPLLTRLLLDDKDDDKDKQKEVKDDPKLGGTTGMENILQRLPNCVNRDIHNEIYYYNFY